jgi:hypothetical protein
VCVAAQEFNKYERTPYGDQYGYSSVNPCPIGIVGRKNGFQNGVSGRNSQNQRQVDELSNPHHLHLSPLQTFSHFTA